MGLLGVLGVVDQVLSETVCLFCFCVVFFFFSNIGPKIKLMAENWSYVCNFYSKVIFWKLCL